MSYRWLFSFSQLFNDLYNLLRCNVFLCIAAIRQVLSSILLFLRKTMREKRKVVWWDLTYEVVVGISFWSIGIICHSDHGRIHTASLSAKPITWELYCIFLWYLSRWYEIHTMHSISPTENKPSFVTSAIYMIKARYHYDWATCMILFMKGWL